MRRISILFLSAFTVLSFATSCESPSSSEGTKAVAANDFLSSIGVNSAIDERGENLEKTLECMQYLGARWIRSGYGYKGMDSFDYLIDKGNIKFSMSIGTGTSDFEGPITAAKYLKKRGALIAMEGANEPNNWTITYNGEEGGGRLSWLPVAKCHRDFYAAIKAEPELKDVDVWSITEAGAETDNVGLQFLSIPDSAECLLPAGTVFADVANVHNYFIHPNWPAPQNNQTWETSDPSSACRADGLYGNNGKTWLNKYQGYSEEQCMTIRKVTTETGTTIGGVVTEEMQALMYMSCYLAQFARGWEYTSMYILRDRSDEAGNQTFGFYTTDYKPRQAAKYLHNLTTILRDEESIKNPGNVVFSIADQPKTVHTLLLQKNDGIFELVVWDERYEGGTDDVTVDLGKTCKNINVYDPTKGVEPIETLAKTGQVSLPMTNHPYILEFRY